MAEYLLNFIVFWGVWLLIPLFVDGMTALSSIISVLVARHRRRCRWRPLDHAPFISIVIPVYNSEETLEACLRSLANQDYPHDRMEVLLLSNGTTDRSFEVFARLHPELPFLAGWHTILDKGKALALNAGIHLARGTYIFNVDSDVVLAPDAVRRVVEAMEAEPDLGAVTGAIEVLPPPEGASRQQRLLAACEFFEYLSAFHVGREHQTLLQSLYTLSGAFSVFRRDVLLETFLYNQETVTEDTDLTFELYSRFRNHRIGCVTTAVAYVHPIESLKALYAQRVRWQRGQLEVSARHHHLLERPWWRLWGFAPSRILLIDHTMAFPRLVWTFLVPILALFGYPLSVLVTAVLFTYAFYVLVDLAWTGIAWLDANELARRRVQRLRWVLPLMPLYRMLVFWFRMSGFLHAAAEEPGQWRVLDPWNQIFQGLHDLRQRTAYAYKTLLSFWL
ncbi:MAG: putative glycosyltransferase, exosortase G system-associated [Ardenticatenia bacterium]|nr:putative glycosyltransferase, exosortase G system-associated [Ardenticatenia bacterium]